MNRRSLLKYITAGVASAAPLAAIQLPRFSNRKRFFGKFDYQAEPLVMEPIEIIESHMGICLLNGVEVKNCCYANTSTGIVRTYDVLHDGAIATASVKRRNEWAYEGDEDLRGTVVDVTTKNSGFPWRQKIVTTIHPGPNPAEWWKPEDFPGRDVSCPIDGVLCETLHGEVEIWGPEL